MMDIVLWIIAAMVVIGNIVIVLRFFRMADDLSGIRAELKGLRQTVADEVNRQFRKDHPLQPEEAQIQSELWVKCPHCHKAISRAGLRRGQNKCPHCRKIFADGPAAPEPEPTAVSCPSCAHPMRADHLRKGENICPSCKAEFVVE